MRSSTCFTVALAAALTAATAFAQSPAKPDAKPAEKPAAQSAAKPAAEKDKKPRTLEGYVEQEKDFYHFLMASHPIFQYEKEGRMVGKYQISDREEEFVEFGGGKDYAKQNNQQVSMTYRLGAESILDLPNNFVGAKKCGECHPAQYQKWQKSRHAKVVRFPDEMDEIPNKDLNKPLYGSQAAVLPEGITADDVYVIMGTPRTKYGFVDSYLVRGSYHVEGGMLKDRTGTLVAGGNQHSHHWAESLTPEMAQKIAGFVPGFPTKIEDFGDNGSKVWGMTSYGAKNRKASSFSLPRLTARSATPLSSTSRMKANSLQPSAIRKNFASTPSAKASPAKSAMAREPTSTARAVLACRPTANAATSALPGTPTKPRPIRTSLSARSSRPSAPPAEPKDRSPTTPLTMKKACAAEPVTIRMRSRRTIGKTASPSLV